MLEARGIPLMLRQQATWNGNEAESYDLLASMQRHCACQFDKAGARVATCPPHDTKWRVIRIFVTASVGKG